MAMIADDLREAIREAHQNGMSLREIGRQSGVDHARIVRFVGEQAPLTLDQAGKITAMLDGKLNFPKIRKNRSQSPAKKF